MLKAPSVTSHGKQGKVRKMILLRQENRCFVCKAAFDWTERETRAYSWHDPTTTPPLLDCTFTCSPLYRCPEMRANFLVAARDLLRLYT